MCYAPKLNPVPLGKLSNNSTKKNLFEAARPAPDRVVMMNAVLLFLVQKQVNFLTVFLFHSVKAEVRV